MKVDYYPYKLKLRHSGLERPGVLLRIDFLDGKVGYADCHPWEQLGDASLKDQLDSMITGQFTPLTKQSVLCARRDGEARAQDRSLFEGRAIPSSQMLILDPALLKKSNLEKLAQEKIKTIKIKGYPTQKLFDDLALLGIRLRIDFNETLKPDEFRSFLETYDMQMQTVDFIEDPCPYDVDLWSDFQKKYSVALACDRESIKAVGHYNAAKYLIYKPAKQDFNHFLVKDARQKFVLTSYMDHPIGQYNAAFIATSLSSYVDSCGLLTHHVYESDPFIDHILSKGPNLLPVGGTGLGFDNLLTALEWQPLK